MEVNYIRFPNARIYFDELSLFSFDHNDLTEFNTHTEAVTLVGKISTYLPNSTTRVYTSAGLRIFIEAIF